MKVSILIAYYNRPKQLERSLWLLERQLFFQFSGTEHEIVLVDDGSEQPIDYRFSCLYDVNGFNYTIRPAGSPPRSPNTALKYAYTHSTGDFVIVGGPEILAPLHGVETMLAKGDITRRNVPVLYYTAWNHRPSTVDWQSSLDNLKQLPDFMATRGEHGYCNADSPRPVNQP